MTETTRETSIFLINGEVLPEHEAAYNAWYTTVHIPELLTLPGFVSGRRLRLAPVQRGSGSTLHSYLAVFEIEGDPAVAFAAMDAAVADGSLQRPPAGRSDSTMGVFVPLGGSATAVQ